MHLTDIATPALALDASKLKRNVARLHQRLKKLGVPLRPHFKTCKSLDALRLMVEGQSGGVTVSTLREADYVLDAGFRDITYAVAIAPGKLKQAAALMAKGADLKLLLDSADAARKLTEAGQALGVRFKALIEINSDGHRAGVTPDDPDLMALGRIIHGGKGAVLEGVLTHAGGSYQCRGAEAIVAMAERERSGAVTAAERLRGAGLPCPVVSIGSTPTAMFTQDLSGVTEVRAGVFVFQDLYQAELGVCGFDDIAMGVVAEIIGRDAASGRLFIDAGALALSKDRSTADSPEDLGYGLAGALGTPASEGDLVVRRVFQEHGLMEPRRAGGDTSRYKIGDRVMVWPNHACMTAAAHDFYHLVDGGGDIVGRWERVNGWGDGRNAPC